MKRKLPTIGFIGTGIIGLPMAFNLIKNNYNDNLKPKLSASSLYIYSQCPLKYKYKYVDKIPDTPEKPFFKLGNIIHKALEIFHEQPKTSLNELYFILEELWDGEVYFYKEEEKQNFEDAKLMLQNYWQYYKSINNEVDYFLTEHAFDFETDYARFDGNCD